MTYNREELTNTIWNNAKAYAGERQQLYLSEEAMGRAVELYREKKALYKSSFVAGMAAAYTNKKPTKERLTKQALASFLEDIILCESAEELPELLRRLTA